MTDFYDAIARFYDAENFDKTDDLLLYSELAAIHGGPILDVGCGSGRVMLHLAQEGYRCVGVDTSHPMLARAERKAQAVSTLKDRVTLVHGDIATYATTTRFQMILLAYHAFMHFPTQSVQLQVLERLVTILADDGVIVFDLPNAGEAFATQDDHAITLERMFTEPESGHLVMQQSSSALDRVTQQLHITWIYDEIDTDQRVHRTVAPLTLRYVFFSELRLLLATYQFTIGDVFGDYDGSPYEDGCPRMIVIARRAG